MIKYRSEMCMSIWSLLNKGNEECSLHIVFVTFCFMATLYHCKTKAANMMLQCWKKYGIRPSDKT